MKKAAILLMALLCLCMQAEAKKEKVTRATQFAKMYEERPQAIVIMPPINKTQHVEAKDYFYSTMYIPLCDRGYYVFPPMLTMEMFQTESAYDAEQFIEADLNKFREVLGADAAMFTIIKNWKRLNALGSITVDVEYILRSTKTGETLYQREGNISIDMRVKTNIGGLWGALADLAATTVSTAATDKIVAGRQCTNYVLSNLPFGQYSPNYDKDRDYEAGSSVIAASL